MASLTQALKITLSVKDMLSWLPGSFAVVTAALVVFAGKHKLVASTAKSVPDWWKKWKEWRESGHEERGTLKHCTLAEGFDYDTLKMHSTYYVSPDIHPYGAAESGAAAESALEYLRCFLQWNDDEETCPYLFIVNDAGTGKTALLTNYALQNERVALRLRTKIALVRLREGADVVDAFLKSFQGDRGRMVVLLDGFDEDPTIEFGDYEKRITTLFKLCHGFRKVVITSRPRTYAEIQPKLEEMLATALQWDAMEELPPQIEVKALSTLSPANVEAILRKRFPRWKPRFPWLHPKRHQNLEFRQKAQRIIEQTDLESRAMVLRYIHSLVSGEGLKRAPGTPSGSAEKWSKWEIYQAIIATWHYRDGKKFRDEKNVDIVNQLATDVAFEIYFNRTTEKQEFVTDAQLRQMLAKLVPAGIPDVQILERSLLHKISGNWEFSHRSIGEFLFVQKFLSLSFNERKLVRWTPLMQEFALHQLTPNGPSFTWTDLTKVNLSGRDLSLVDFRHVLLENAILEGANCRDADFSEANLSAATFDGASTLKGANFLAADTRGTHLDASTLWSIRNLSVAQKAAAYIHFPHEPAEAQSSGLARSFVDRVAGFGSSIFTNDLGIALGAANTVISVPGHGVVLREPSVVAVKAGTNRVLAVGNEAKRMLGRTPANIVAVRPLKDGVIADFEITEAMLRHFITKVHNRAKWVKLRVVIAVPSGITEVEKRVVKESAMHAGAREVHLIEEPMAAAIGVGLPVQDAAGNMIILIDRGTTEVALISLSSIIFSRSVRVGGDELDEAIVNHVKLAYNVMIGERTAEEIKIKIGSAFPPADAANEMTMEIKGRELVAGLPKTLTITSQEVREALLEPINTIVESVRITLERCPPELAADLVERGLVLAGGGALLRGLDDLLMQETGLPVRVAENPLSAVVEGTGKLLSETKFLRQVASSERSWR